MKLITLTKGQVAIIDDEDWELVSRYSWVYAGAGYAYARQKGKKNPITMHSLIANPGRGREVDHIDRNRLNNRRTNLRVCNRKENSRNRATRAHSSQFCGVCWDKRTKKWAAYIQIDYKTLFLGYFPTELAAAMAYDIAAYDLHGEFANLNFKTGTHG